MPNFLGKIAGFFAGRRDDSDRYAADSRVLTGEWVAADSSNVQQYRYFRESEVLQVAFHNGSVYSYSGVSPADAVSFDVAPSKGRWVWDNLRVRGKGNAHLTRKPFGRIQ